MKLEKLNELIKDIKPLDNEAMKKADERQNQLIKPLGSLGKLEDIATQMAGITGNISNNLDRKVLFLFGADNGIYAEGISSAPQMFTNLLISCYGAKKNSGINVICDKHGVDLKVIDMGVVGKLDYSGIDNHRLMEGTDNFAEKPAMSIDTAFKAINIGFDYAKWANENDYNIIGTGEVGIGNTTTASACIMAALSTEDADIAVGRGAGLSDEQFAHKKNVILNALMMHRPDKNNPIDILSKVGGLDIAALVGLYIGAAYYRLPIVIDGVISIAAALLAFKLAPAVKGYMFASHLSDEPAYKLAAAELDISAYLNLNMRLGEGTGCPMAMQIIDTALAVLNNMDTFEDLELDSGFRV